MSDLIYQFSQQAHPGRLTALGAGIRDIGLGIQQRRAEAARIEQLRKLQEQAMNSMDPADWSSAMSLANPEEMAKMQESFKMMDTQRRESEIRNYAQLNAALLNDPAGMGAKLLDRYAAAAEEAGNLDQAEDYREALAKIQSGDPNALKMVQGTYAGLASGIPGYSDAVGDQMFAFGKEMRDRAMSDAEITETMTNITVASPEERKEMGDKMAMLPGGFGRALSELIRVRKATGDMDSNEVFKAEQALRKEYDDYVADFNTMISGASQMQTMLEQGTGAADQAMIMLFNKVLDPNSVVRESEARMTAGNQAAVDRARAYLASLSEGDRLSDTGRKELAEASKILADLAQDRKGAERERINETVKAFGFGEERIFFTEDPLAEEAPAPTGAGVSIRSNVIPVAGNRLAEKRAFVKQSNPQSSANFDAMSDEELSRYNAGRLFDEQNPVTAVEEETVEVDW